MLVSIHHFLHIYIFNYLLCVVYERSTGRMNIGLIFRFVKAFPTEFALYIMHVVAIHI